MKELSGMDPGARASVVRIEGGHALAHRLTAMGVRPGTILTVVRGRGPMIVEAGGQRLVLGRGMLDRILVEPYPERADP